MPPTQGCQFSCRILGCFISLTPYFANLGKSKSRCFVWIKMATNSFKMEDPLSHKYKLTDYQNQDDENNVEHLDKYWGTCLRMWRMSGLAIWECPTQPNATKLFQTAEAKVNATVAIRKIIFLWWYCKKKLIKQVMYLQKHASYICVNQAITKSISRWNFFND